MIHKNIYSNRIKDIDEMELYLYEITGTSTINSFLIFFSKFKENEELVYALEDYCETKRAFISEELMKHIIYDYIYNTTDLMNDLGCLLANASTENILDFCDIFIERINMTIKYDEDIYYQIREVENFKNTVITDLNNVFEHNMLGYEVVNDVIVTKESEFLHNEVVKKTLTLLKSQEFNGALAEFTKAVHSFTQHHYEDVLIEACKSFESTMKCILDKKEIVYDRTKLTATGLVEELKKNNLFDSFLGDGFSKVINILNSSLPTVRNRRAGHGDGIEVDEVSRSYASLAINLAGTYIVFLIDRYFETLY